MDGEVLEQGLSVAVQVVERLGLGPEQADRMFEGLGFPFGGDVSRGCEVSRRRDVSRGCRGSGVRLEREREEESEFAVIRDGEA